MINLLNEELLEENLLKSDFTYGFELEGVARGYRYDSYDYDDEEYEDEDDDGSQYYSNIEGNILSLFNRCGFGEYKGNGEIQHDGSIETDESDEVAFEWASPVLKATPKNFQATIEFLSHLGDSCDIYTNESCGFHHHLSWKGITERDMIWTYINLCMDSDYIDSLETLIIPDGSDIPEKINMASSRWASKQALTDIRNAVLNRDWETIVDKMSDDKYRILRIHPYGTIEWRGPRDFLNEGGIKAIHSFYMKFNKLISKVIQCQNNKTIEGTDITKQELFDNMTKAMENMPDKHPELEFLHRNGEYRDRNMSYKTEKGKALSQKVLRALDSNPVLLFDIIKKNPKNIAKLFENSKNFDIGWIIRTAFNNLDDDSKQILADLLVKGYTEAGYPLRRLSRVDSTFLDYVDTNELAKQIIENADSLKELEYELENDSSIILNSYNNVFPLILDKIKEFGNMDRWSAKSLINAIVNMVNDSNKVSVSVFKRTANLVVRLYYNFTSQDDEFNRWSSNFSGFVKKLSRILEATGEAVKWNDSIINAIIDKGQARSLGAFIIAPSTFTEKQKKQIIALCIQNPKMKNILQFEINDEVLKKYIDMIKED